MKTISVQIPFELAQAVDALAAHSCHTRSKIVRQALRAFVQKHASIPQGQLLRVMPDLVGCFAGGAADLSVNPAHLSGFGLR